MLKDQELDRIEDNPHIRLDRRKAGQCSFFVLLWQVNSRIGIIETDLGFGARAPVIVSLGRRGYSRALVGAAVPVYETPDVIVHTGFEPFE